jgi:hypothetical protein
VFLEGWQRGGAEGAGQTMMRMITMLFFSAAMSASAMAATVTNKDAEAHVLVVVEGGSRMEVAIDAGSTQTICPSGCFVTLPNGDRIGLAGGETVEIEAGAASVK